MKRLVFLLIFGAVIGVATDRNYKKAINFTRDALADFGFTAPRPSARVAHGRDALQKNPMPASCPDPSKERVAVLLTAGQSNASNEGGVGEPAPTYSDAVLNLWNGRCFIARHPLLGATGGDQSPWIETAKLLLASGKFSKVVIVATAIGGTGAHEWASGGEFHERMLKRIAEAKAAGLTPTPFLWHQGEHEGVNRKAGAAYEANLVSIINSVRRQTGDIPALIALASRCSQHGPSDEIRNAQRRVAQSLSGVLVAVDSDAIGLAHRYDGCHFTVDGLHLLAHGYAKTITH